MTRGTAALANERTYDTALLFPIQEQARCNFALCRTFVLSLSNYFTYDALFENSLKNLDRLFLLIYFFRHALLQPANFIVSLVQIYFEGSQQLLLLSQKPSILLLKLILRELCSDLKLRLLFHENGHDFIEPNQKLLDELSRFRPIIVSFVSELD